MTFDIVMQQRFGYRGYPCFCMTLMYALIWQFPHVLLGSIAASHTPYVDHMFVLRLACIMSNFTHTFGGRKHGQYGASSV